MTPPGRRARGATLVEVAVALLLLGTGALALAGGIQTGEAARRRALASGLALAAAEGWLETWRETGAPAGSGTARVAWGGRGAALDWRIAMPAPCVAEARVAVVPDRAAAPAVVLATRRYGGAGCP